MIFSAFHYSDIDAINFKLWALNSFLKTLLHNSCTFTALPNIFCACAFKILFFENLMNIHDWTKTVIKLQF